MRRVAERRPRRPRDAGDKRVAFGGSKSSPHAVRLPHSQGVRAAWLEHWAASAVALRYLLTGSPLGTAFGVRKEEQLRVCLRQLPASCHCHLCQIGMGSRDKLAISPLQIFLAWEPEP
jgi:hypothetical protein